MWYVCDNCLQAIKAGKARYEVEKKTGEAEADFTLCAGCFRENTRPLKFKKLMIPKLCKVRGGSEIAAG